MPPRPIRHSIRGKVFRILLERPDDGKSMGECEPPMSNAPMMRLDPKLGPRRFLDTLIHEFIHAGAWELPEEVVNQLASDIERAIWRFGYRRRR